MHGERRGLFEADEATTKNAKQVPPPPRKFLIASLAINAALLIPLSVNQHLRWTFAQTLAIWASHFRSPKYVFIGDSMTAGGRMFGRFDTINLGSTGLSAHQIAEGLAGIDKYSPRRIVVMAGTNDAFDDFDAKRLRADWAKIASDRRTIIVLLPPTRSAVANARIASMNAIASDEARKANKKPIVLGELIGPDGMLPSQYSVDGVHLTDEAYRFWEKRLP